MGIQKKLSTQKLISYVIDNTLGYTLFLLPTFIRYCPSLIFSYFILFLCFIIALILSINYARLGILFNKGYGEPTYYEIFYGSIAKTIYSLTSICIISPLCLLSSISYSTSTLPGSIWIKKLIIIILFTILNIFFIRISLIIQVILTFFKLLIITEIPILAILLKMGLLESIENTNMNVFNNLDAIKIYFNQNKNKNINIFKSFISQLPLIINAFDGFNSANYITEDIENPSISFYYLPLSIIFTFIIYLITQTSFFYVIPINKLLYINTDIDSAITLFHKQFTFIGNSTFLINCFNILGSLSNVNGSFIISIYVTKSLTKKYWRHYILFMISIVYIIGLFFNEVECMISYQTICIYIFYVLTMFILIGISRNPNKYIIKDLNHSINNKWSSKIWNILGFLFALILFTISIVSLFCKK